MKLILIMVLATVLATCFKPINAGEFEFNVKHMSDHAADDKFRFTSWRGIEVKYQEDKDSLYYFVSSEEARVFMASPSFTMNFTGIGLGVKKPVTDSINLYGQMGYYFIKPEVEGRFKCALGECHHAESLYYGVNNKWESVHSGDLVRFNEYEITSTPGYGLTLGGELMHPLTKDLNLTFGAEWRAMSFTVLINSWYEGQHWPWMSSFKGFSSTNYKIGLSYSF